MPPRHQTSTDAQNDAIYTASETINWSALNILTSLLAFPTIGCSWHFLEISIFSLLVWTSELNDNDDKGDVVVYVYQSPQSNTRLVDVRMKECSKARLIQSVGDIDTHTPTSVQRVTPSLCLSVLKSESSTTATNWIGVRR